MRAACRRDHPQRNAGRLPASPAARVAGRHTGHGSTDDTAIAAWPPRRGRRRPARRACAAAPGRLFHRRPARRRAVRGLARPVRRPARHAGDPARRIRLPRRAPRLEIRRHGGQPRHRRGGRLQSHRPAHPPRLARPLGHRLRADRHPDPSHRGGRAAHTGPPDAHRVTPLPLRAAPQRRGLAHPDRRARCAGRPRPGPRRRGGTPARRRHGHAARRLSRGPGQATPAHDRSRPAARHGDNPRHGRRLHRATARHARSGARADRARPPRPSQGHHRPEPALAHARAAAPLGTRRHLPLDALPPVRTPRRRRRLHPGGTAARGPSRPVAARRGARGRPHRRGIRLLRPLDLQPRLPPRLRPHAERGARGRPHRAVRGTPVAQHAGASRFTEILRLL